MKTNLKNILEEKRNKWLKMYSQTAKRAAEWWVNRNSNDSSIPSKSEAAFDLISAIANIIRFSGESDKLTIIKNLSSDERKELSLAALDYISKSSLKDDVEKILNSNNDYEDDEIELFEDYLQTRDDFQIVWDIIKQITSDFIEKDDDFLKNYTLTRCLLAEIDELFAERMDIVAVASRSLELVRDMSEIELNETNYWWLFEARNNIIENVITNANALADFLIMTPHKLPQEIKTNIIEDFFKPAVPTYELQAAQSENYSFLLVWDKPINELKKYKGAISETAKLDDFIRKIDSNYSASWQVKNVKVEKKSPVIIVTTDTKKLLAYAEFDPNTKTITLDEIISEKNFEKYINKPEKLLLIILTKT